MDALTIRLPEEILEEISQLAVKKNRKIREVARDLIIEGLRMSTLKDDHEETHQQIKKILAYAEWNQSMVGELARLICGSDREKYTEYGQKVKANYQAFLKKSNDE